MTFRKQVYKYIRSISEFEGYGVKISLCCILYFCNNGHSNVLYTKCSSLLQFFIIRANEMDKLLKDKKKNVIKDILS